MSDFETTELNRRTSNVVKFGAIEEVDYANAKVKVRMGDLLTAWIPWTSKSSNNASWLAPEIGEQVVVASPSGELNQGVVLGSIPQDLHPPAGNSVDKHTMVYGDGTVIEYDRAAHHLKAVLSGGGTVEIVASGGVLITADNVTIVASGGVAITGNVAVQGNITATGTITP